MYWIWSESCEGADLVSWRPERREAFQADASRICWWIEAMVMSTRSREAMGIVDGGLRQCEVEL